MQYNAMWNKNRCTDDTFVDGVTNYIKCVPYFDTSNTSVSKRGRIYVTCFFDISADTTRSPKYGTAFRGNIPLDQSNDHKFTSGKVGAQKQDQHSVGPGAVRNA